jgi:ribosomal 30S subunit maturation factor RimM
MFPARPGDGRARVVLGRIGAPFGVRGWVKVQSFTDPR